MAAAPLSASPSPGPSKSSTPVPRHATSATDKQRMQLERLLKDPAKPAFVPPPPKEKSIRPAREMMKNVQGSSAGAGSGEFHVYKASRRREYERLKMLEEESLKVCLEPYASYLNQLDLPTIRKQPKPSLNANGASARSRLRRRRLKTAQSVRRRRSARAKTRTRLRTARVRTASPR